MFFQITSKFSPFQNIISNSHQVNFSGQRLLSNLLKKKPILHTTYPKHGFIDSSQISKYINYAHQRQARNTDYLKNTVTYPKQAFYVIGRGNFFLKNFLPKMYLLSSTSICFLFQLDFVGFESEPFEYAYEAKDVILYNLGVGASLSQANGVDLLYEGSENFGALTSFGVIPAMGGLSGLITGKVPGLQIDLAKVNPLIS